MVLFIVLLLVLFKMFLSMFLSMFLTLLPLLFPTSGERDEKREIDKMVHLNKADNLKRCIRAVR